MLADSFVAAVRDAARIEDIAGDHSHLKPASGRLFGVCPLHQEKTPSFSVDPKTGLFYCFGCGRGGDAIGLHMAVTGDDFRQAIEAIAHRYGIPVPADRADEHADLFAALNAAQMFFRGALRGSPGEQYLSARGIAEESRERYGIGYAPRGWRLLQEAMRARYSPALLVACGLAIDSGSGQPYDRFRNRITFPIRDAAGRVCGFSARALADEQPKYMNSPEGPTFRKGALLFGANEARAAARASGRIVLCEGQPDVIAADASGLPAVAPLGTALTAEQVAAVSRLARTVVVAFDPDAAGEGAARKALPALLRAGLTVYRAELPGVDLDGVLSRNGADAVRALIEGAPDALLRESAARGSTPQERANVSRHLAELLAAVRDDFLRAEYAAEIERRMGFRPILREEPAPPLAPVASALVRPLEALALELLMAEGAELPDPEELPPAEAFAEPWRLPYSAFLNLYVMRGSQPSVPELLRAMPPASTGCAALAGLAPDAACGSVRGTLSALYRRHARAALPFADEDERAHLQKILAKRY